MNPLCPVIAMPSGRDAGIVSGLVAVNFIQVAAVHESTVSRTNLQNWSLLIYNCCEVDFIIVINIL